MKSTLFFLLSFSLTSFCVAQSTNFITLSPTSDNTLYESSTGSLSNGQGQDLHVGTNASGEKRRTVLKFDLTQVPANSIITSCFLSLEVAQTSSSRLLSCNRMLSDWGEGLSNAGLNGDSGTTPMMNDATWIHSFYSGQNWNNAGGDFSPVFSDTSTSFPTPGPLNFSSTRLLDDVKLFYDSAQLNFGWIILGNESVAGTDIEFHSVQSIRFLRPKLNIGYLSTTNLTEMDAAPPVSLFPNPASEQLHLSNLHLTGKKQRYSVYDVDGKQIVNEHLNSAEISLKGLNNGTYFLVLKNKFGIESRFKFIKQ